MRHQKTKLFVFLLMVFIMAGLDAQHAFPVTGGEANGTGGTVSYTIGQVWYTTLIGDDVTISQGVQQPFEILKSTGIHSYPGITLNASLFPNPAGDYVSLKVDNHSLDGLTYQLYNMQGRLLEKRRITSNETLIQMSHLGTATYMIKITLYTDDIKAFKIIKK